MWEQQILQKHIVEYEKILADDDVWPKYKPHFICQDAQTVDKKLMMQLHGRKARV